MPHLTPPAIFDVLSIDASAHAAPDSEHCGPYSSLHLTLSGNGDPLFLQVFFPRERAEYTHRLAAAINAVPVVEKQPSEDRRVPRYPDPAEAAE